MVEQRLGEARTALDRLQRIRKGRGSAANSVVCYCIGVTEVDPARMSVLFPALV